MHASRLSHRWLASACPWMHAKRREALATAVVAAVLGARLTVTALGRSMRSPAMEKHCIKRADRLLSNVTLQEQCFDVYRAQARHILGAVQRPVVLVDWSDLDASQTHFLLRASTPLGGRSLTLYEEVHPLGGKDKPGVHQAFLRKFQAVVPAGCRPIVVTDAGFRTPWFKQVERFGWDWVGRIRHRHMVQFAETDPWMSAKSLYEQATGRPKDLGEVRLTRNHALDCRLVLYKARPKGRVKTTRFGQRARSRHSQKNAARERDPWLLATSLPAGSSSAKQIVALYATRMQIEEAFRDIKSARYGLSLEYSGTRQLQRLQVLLLIGSLAMMVLWLLGKATELTGQHRQFQANTIKHRTVLSTIFLGLQVSHDRRIALTDYDLRIAGRVMRTIVKTYMEET
jgi:hypothetical protein